MSWQKEVDELREQTEFAKDMGGADSVAFHHSRGRLTVRERIALLEDPGTFHEVGAIAGTAQWQDDSVVGLKPANSVAGTVLIDGRKVAVSGGDFTIRGGAADAAVGNKGGFAEQFALQARIPYVRLLDATGGSVKTFEKMGRTYLPGNAGTNHSASLLQFVPVVSAVLGSVAGLPAVQACLCHFNVMVRNTSQVFVAGPKVVEQATGQVITKEDLGDERIQVKNGVVMNLAEDEADAIAQIRRFLSYLPANVWEAPPVIESDDDPERREESLVSAVPRNRRRIYDPRLILDAVLDKDSFFEIGPYYGRARVTGLARVNGHPVGVMANHPKYNGGSMDIATGEKTIRLIELCDTFHLPLVYFADEPGPFSVGRAQEELGIVRAGARVVTTLTQSKTPYICFVLRQLYGVAGGSASAWWRRSLPALLLAFHTRWVHAHRGRYRHRLQTGHRERAGSGGSAPGDRSPFAGDLVAVPQRPRVRHRGDHRSEGNAAAVGGLRRRCVEGGEDAVGAGERA